MKKIVIVILLFNFKITLADDFKLICFESSKSFDNTFVSSFTKIVNFEKQTFYNLSGGYFDEVILFGRNEIILNNSIFNSRSTFNILTNKWITYKGRTIKLYDCIKEKRRF